MVKFSIIYENLLKGVNTFDGYVEVFKNPSSSELKDSDDRAVLDLQGNLYVSARMDQDNTPPLLHEDLLDLLGFNHDQYYGFSGEKISGVTIMSQNMRDWYLGESMFYKEEPSEKDINKVRDILKKAGKKNRGLTFHMKNLTGREW